MDSEGIGLRTQRTCSVCTRKKAQYNCPKCQTAYCSLECYENHKDSCVAEFHRSSQESLKNTYASSSEKQKMQRILHKYWTDESEVFEDALNPEEQELLLRQLLEELDFEDPEVVFQKLPKNLQTKFRKLIAQGELDDLIEVWKPWWEEDAPFVIEVVPQEGSSKASNSSSQTADSSSENFFGKKPPSPKLKWHLIELCFAYCYTMRLFNGDVLSDSLDSLQCLLTLSKVISEDRRYNTLSEAVNSVIINSLDDLHYSNSRDFSVLIIEDVGKIFQFGRYSLLRFLGDCRNLVASAASELGKRSRDEQFLKKKAWRADKKLAYFEDFVRCYWNGDWSKEISYELSTLEKNYLEYLQNREKPNKLRMHS
eukprot:jgi/Galph1/3187/GphlegSOOS_G1827.1